MTCINGEVNASKIMVFPGVSRAAGKRFGMAVHGLEVLEAVTERVGHGAGVAGKAGGWQAEKAADSGRMGRKALAFFPKLDSQKTRFFKLHCPFMTRSLGVR